MKRSIQIQIALVIISIFVLIGVLFYNPPDVEKKTEILVDFGDGNPRPVGDGRSAKDGQEVGSATAPVVETDGTSLSPVADNSGSAANGEATPAKASVNAVPPVATANPKLSLLPKGTPPPLTPKPTPLPTGAGENSILFPGGIGGIKLETLHK